MASLDTNLDTKPAPAKSILPWKTSTVIYSIILGIVAFIVLYPLILLLLNSFQVGTFGQQTTLGLENWRIIFEEPDLRQSIINTVTLAFSRQLIAIIIGIFLAWLIARTDPPGKNWLEMGFWIATFMPVLSVTLAWIVLFDDYNGLANQWLEKLPFIEKGPFNIYTFWGINWVHLLTGTLPVKVMLLSPAFRNMDAAMEEASRTTGASTLGTLIRITTPIMFPAIAVAFVLGLIRSLEAFEVELILGVQQQIDVYSTMIYHLVFQEPPLYGSATALSTLALILIVPMILLQQWIISRGNYTTVSGKYSARIHRLGRWRWPAFAFVSSLVFLMTVLPILVILVSSFSSVFGHFGSDQWTAENWKAAFSATGFADALINTLKLSVGAALLSLPLLFMIAYISVRTKYQARGVLDFLTWLPSSLPGIIMGLGYIWLILKTPFFQPLYGSMLVLILVVLLGNLTFGSQLLKTSMLQLGNELEEASFVSGGSLFYTMRRIVLPLIAPAAAVVAVVIFAGAARSTAHVALLASPTNKPLPLLQLDMMADGRLEAATVIGVIVMFMTVGAALVARFFGLNVGPKHRL